ncbi:hypothetical protein QF033_000290 [Bacillus pumilus]|nr:hypothetical protein [Bacillus pumilus]
MRIFLPVFNYVCMLILSVITATLSICLAYARPSFIGCLILSF